MTASTAVPTVVVRRTLPAPARHVYRVWTEPQFLTRWNWGPQHETISVEIDVRAGGKWTQRIRNAKTGGEWWFEGEFREVVPGQRLVHTFHWRGDKGENDGPSLVAIDFIDRGDQCEVVITHSQVMDEKSQAGHEKGWNDVLDAVASALD